MAIDCPTCGDPLTTRGVCGSCGYGRKARPAAPSHNEGDRYAILAERARQDSQQKPPTSAALTAQQWYNVCKYWPNVAAHCKRTRPIVGPDNPLDATAHEGPMFRGMRRRGDDPDAIEERTALQSEAA